MQIRDDARAAFLRWRSAGDLTALAHAFDLVAQELLLVASHVANRGLEPEDLLQETFLTALQRADRFDAARPLEPWLVGILVNVARNSRRREHRDRVGFEVAGERPEPDPSDSAAAGELAEHLRAAIATLAVPQREVMTLHLVHGMTPTEIAHATSRPVGTVKSWIHRSRDEVRRRLPTGVLASFGTLLRGMDRLPQLRAAVLDAARALATGASVGAVGAISATLSVRSCLHHPAHRRPTRRSRRTRRPRPDARRPFLRRRRRAA
jgi:RNA polymerase sigma factor (sigma-70 family)